MRKRLMAAVLAAAAFTGTTGVAGAQEKGGSRDTTMLQAELAQVRRATAKFHNIEAAEAAGYINPGAEHCTELPGVGGMGVHVLNPQLVFDGEIDPLKPEVLLFAPTHEGLRLVGVEYLMPTSAWTGDGDPSLFGKVFDGPMAEHEPNTTGDHWDLHVWTWSHNPDGLLATWNPDLRC